AGRVDARLRRPVAQDPGDVLIGHPPSAEHRVDRLRVLLGSRIRVLIAVVMSPPLTLTDVIGPTDIEVTDVLTQCLSLYLARDASPARTQAAGDQGEPDPPGRTRADPRSDHACYEKAAAGHRTPRLGAESGQAALGVVERVLSWRGHL